MKTKKAAILSAGLIALLCVAVIAGATFALFGVSRENEIVVSTGSVDVSAAASDLTTSSLSATDPSGTAVNDPVTSFATGGTAKLEDGVLTLTGVVPGDSATFTLTVTNTGSVSAKLRVNAVKEVTGSNGAADKLLLSVKNGSADFALDTWACGTDGADLVLAPQAVLTLTVTVSLDKNAVQSVGADGAVEQFISAATIKLTVYAGQANAAGTDLDGALGINND